MFSSKLQKMKKRGNIFDSKVKFSFFWKYESLSRWRWRTINILQNIHTADIGDGGKGKSTAFKFEWVFHATKSLWNMAVRCWRRETYSTHTPGSVGCSWLPAPLCKWFLCALIYQGHFPLFDNFGHQYGPWVAINMDLAINMDPAWQ